MPRHFDPARAGEKSHAMMRFLIRTSFEMTGVENFSFLTFAS